MGARHDAAARAAAVTPADRAAVDRFIADRRHTMAPMGLSGLDQPHAPLTRQSAGVVERHRLRRQEYIDMAARGYTRGQTAKILGVAETQVAKMAAMLGITFPLRKRPSIHYLAAVAENRRRQASIATKQRGTIR